MRANGIFVGLFFFFLRFHLCSNRQNDLVNLVRMMMPSRVALPPVYTCTTYKQIRSDKMVYFISLKRTHSWTSCRQYFISFIFFYFISSLERFIFVLYSLCFVFSVCVCVFFFTLNFICPVRCSRQESQRQRVIETAFSRIADSLRRRCWWWWLLLLLFLFYTLHYQWLYSSLLSVLSSL